MSCSPHNRTFLGPRSVTSQRARYGISIVLLWVSALVVGCSRESSQASLDRPDLKTVTEDGKTYQQWAYLDVVVRVPDGERVNVWPGLGPQWGVRLPDTVRAARPREREPGASRFMSVSLYDSGNMGAREEIFLRLYRGEPVGQLPTETFPEWGLAYYRSPLERIRRGDGKWVPLDPGFRSPNGRHPVISCASQITDVDLFPDSLLCRIEVRVSDRVGLRASFDGNVLPTWQVAHDQAWAFINERVRVQGV
jgi:hypothetical protein